MALVLNATLQQKRFYRQSFEVKKEGKSILFHTLLINPEDLQMDEPSRSTVTQTLGGAYVTDFGQGLPTMVISGTTGYKRREKEGKQTDGYQEFIDFRNKVYRDFVATNDPSLAMYWYNWEDNEYYEIQPENFRLMRNKSEPLLYRYEFRFTCIKRLTNASRKINDNLKVPSAITMGTALGLAISSIGELLTRCR